MKTPLAVIVLAALGAAFAAAQTPSPAEAATSPYRFIAVDGADTAALAAGLEQRFEVWNRLFRFDPARLSAPLTVKLFAAPEAWAVYTAARAGKTEKAASAVYLHYADPAERELAVLQGADNADLPYQSFVQFFRAFVPNPPPWMLRGFAVFFSGLRWNAAAGKIEYRENLVWLAQARRILGEARAAANLEQAMKSAGGNLSAEHAEALSWALASFFLSDTESEYFRALTDSFMILEPGASAQANENAVFLRMSLFADTDTLQTELAGYLAALKTADELIAAGATALGAKDYAYAALLFLKAKEQKPSSPAPYYYLGVTAYERKDYEEAETRYAEALERGADRALIRYARGMCAAGRGDAAEAKKLLEETAAGTEGEERYRALARELLARMR